MNQPNLNVSIPKYRADIDGLRAIAIILVIGFHVFPNEVQSGFIGVDIFFVISGFLISTNLFKSLKTNTFSLIDFYNRRVRRIFPALLVVLISSFIFGWFFLFSDEYKQLGKHIAGGTTFISNILLSYESGYFDNSAGTKPLMHLWSLGLEEQFYIFWPLLIWLVWKLKANLLSVFSVVLLLSFFLNFAEVTQDPTTAFYLPHTRFWELLIGFVIAYLHHHPDSIPMKLKTTLSNVLSPQIINNILSALGISFITAGAFFITKEGSFPGEFALLPTLGAALIIFSGPLVWFNRFILSSRFLVWIGLISYPLYLWHWPLLSFAHIIETKSPSFEIRLGAILISILLSWLTFEKIEKPIQNGKLRLIKSEFLVAGMAVMGLIGFACYKWDGFAFRSFPQKYKAYTQSIARSDREIECFDLPNDPDLKDKWYCKFGDDTKDISFFAYGDSHALSLIPSLEKFSSVNNLKVGFAGISNCPPFLNVASLTGEKSPHKYNCTNFNYKIFNFIKNQKIKNVILVGRWTMYTGGGITTKKLAGLADYTKESINIEAARDIVEKGLQRTIEEYKKMGVKVFILEENPHQLKFPHEALRLSNPNDGSINSLAVTQQENRQNQLWFSTLLNKISAEDATLIKTNDLLCNDSICPLAQQGKLLYFDDNHLTNAGSMLLSDRLNEVLLNKTK